MEIELKENLNEIDLINNMSSIECKLNINNSYDLNINLCSGRFINVTVVAILANWINYIKKRGYTISVQTNISKECEYKDYIARMNFFRIIDVPYEEKFLRHDEDGKFLPISMLKNYDSNVINKLSLIFKNVLSFEENNPTFYMLDYSINEIVENVDRHSETSSDSTIVSQYYRNNNKLEVTIIDNGIGIPNALRKTLEYKEWNDEQCLCNSTKKNVRTIGIDNEGQGNGLYILKRFVNKCKGSLIIYSGNSVYEYDGSKNSEKSFKINGFWNGTIIKFIISTDVKINVKEVMEDDNYECYSPVYEIFE
ncbi:ATP-binding protein [Parvimonas micra]|uniref:ATP-binding protein n=1 Tax=Parvimonas micra TaxID=33033 RepID=UPI000424D133|nr:ATP-binding protein [Parvimonas micra]